MNHGIEAQDLILNEMQNIADFIDDQGKEIFPDGGPSVIKRPSPPKSPIKKKEKAKDKILQMIVEILGEVFSLEDILSDLLDLFLEDKSIKKLIKKMKKTFSSAKSTSKKMKRLVRHLISLLKHLSSPAFIQQAAQSVGKKLLPRLATALAKRLVPFIGWASFFVDFSIAVAKNWVSIKKAFA
ncbi:MAG: hypothetical protein ISR53_07335 [Rhodospirillales bacterium]|nr:hypothetical protein [Rhodospirillales bacterium]